MTGKPTGERQRRWRVAGRMLLPVVLVLSWGLFSFAMPVRLLVLLVVVFKLRGYLRRRYEGGAGLRLFLPLLYAVMFTVMAGCEVYFWSVENRPPGALLEDMMNSISDLPEGGPVLK